MYRAFCREQCHDVTLHTNGQCMKCTPPDERAVVFLSELPDAERHAKFPQMAVTDGSLTDGSEGPESEGEMAA